MVVEGREFVKLCPGHMDTTTTGTLPACMDCVYKHSVYPRPKGRWMPRQCSLHNTAINSLRAESELFSQGWIFS